MDYHLRSVRYLNQCQHIANLSLENKRTEINIQKLSFAETNLNTLSAEWQPFCVSSNVLIKMFPGAYLFEVCVFEQAPQSTGA